MNRAAVVMSVILSVGLVLSCAGSGAGNPSGNCPDSCKAAELKCDDNTLFECATSAGCPDWVVKSDCGARGGVCTASESPAACHYACKDEGLEICFGNVVRTCTRNPSGNLEYIETQDCGTLSCKIRTPGTAKCEGICEASCYPLNAKQCNVSVIEECRPAPEGCLTWTPATVCPLGQHCVATGSTLSCEPALPTGEDCGHVAQVKKGPNSIKWTASVNNYLTSSPPCLGFEVTGPDVVLVYQPGFTGSADLTLQKPGNSQWGAIATSGTCGDLSSPISCMSGEAETFMGDSFSVSAGAKYFFYFAGGSSTPLSNPLEVHVAELDCGNFSAGVVSLSPANGGTTDPFAPVLWATFETAVNTTTGTVTLTGNKGTNLSYSVANSPELSFGSNNKSLAILPSAPLPAGEAVTVSWAGMTDATCSNVIQPANWSFTVYTPP